MRNIYDSRQRLEYAFIIAAVLTAVASLVISNRLISKLANEERDKVAIWAAAGRAMVSEDTNLNMELTLRVLQGNTTIPVILVDEKGHIAQYRNIELPEKGKEAFLQKKLAEFKRKNKPIPIDLKDGSFQYIYYDDSIILKRLIVFPYLQLGVVFVFILIAFLAWASTKKAEQNKVWVGLSKETAHQLGTPISSLIAWVEYLRGKEPQAFWVEEMAKDVGRLEMIAERFSKIGSNPSPVPVDICSSIRSALGYMEKRVSAKVSLESDLPAVPVVVLMNESLFAWVVENLVKNAADAMGGQGKIRFKLDDSDGKRVRIDVSDTGKGIPKSKFKTVFNPGYTTKARGWGLGLSLVKRIIESYHGGRIFVKSSEMGRGTTFRIELHRYKG
ncbi:MAG: HAMP domain-containing histidine kinase [Tannerella sp.]|jgi:two-component sensor histidine kinase|nr:HAMP domain-containing histidine kinase [Tannerella sp.]